MQVYHHVLPGMKADTAAAFSEIVSGNVNGDRNMSHQRRTMDVDEA